MSASLNLILRAAAFAAHKHRDDRRKDLAATPYINHPLALAQVLAEEGGVEDAVTIAAALLHDTIEDTQTRYEELVEAFGVEVADVVMEVSDDKTLAAAQRKRLQVEHAPGLSARAVLVKLADKICNLRDMASNPPHQWTLQRRKDYFDWARQVVERMPHVNERLRARFDEAYARQGELDRGHDAHRS